MIMSKFMYQAFLITLAALVMSGCTRLQEPTSLNSNSDGLQSGSLGFNSDQSVSSGQSEDWSSDDYLSDRSAEDGIEDGRYNGRTMMAGILEPVYYGFDSSAIAAAERVKLQQAADYLLENPTRGLLLEGRCDWYGTTEYNLALGDRRAASAQDYLKTLGVDHSRMETLSKGSLDATSGLSKIDSALDRRVDLIILE